MLGADSSAAAEGVVADIQSGGISATDAVGGFGGVMGAGTDGRDGSMAVEVAGITVTVVEGV